MIRLNFKKLVKKMMIALGVVFLILLAVFLANISIWHRIERVPERDLRFPRGESSITWIGHSTLLLHLDDVNIITDPMYSDFILLFAKRYYEPAVKFENLPPIDLICISHEHYDHLDKATLERFPKDMPVIISKGIGNKVRNIGFMDVRELGWWKSTEVKGVRITAVPGRHGGARISGYVIEGAKTIYFAGDTAFFDVFNEIGKKFDIDVALLPISHYRSRNGNPRVDRMLKTIHMGPGNFPDAIRVLGAKLAIPIHYKTFKNVGSLELPLEEPARYLREIIKKYSLKEKVKILELGEQMKLNYLDKK